MRETAIGIIGGIAILASGCGSGPATAGDQQRSASQASANVDRVTTPSATALTPADRDAIMAAAGYVKTRGKWLSNCDGDTSGSTWEGQITHVGDLTGDGVVEAIVEGGDSSCYGMTGSAYSILMKSGASWVSALSATGLPQVYSQAGGAPALLEIGGPGSYCFATLRWDGKTFKHIGYSTGGKFCEQLRFSKIGGLPIGYYEKSGWCPAQGLNEACVGYLAGDRFIEISDGDFVGMKPLGSNRFQITHSFPSEDGGDDRSSEVIEVGQGYSFRYLNATYYFVQRDRVPKQALLLELPQYRGDPRFDSVRGQ